MSVLIAIAVYSTIENKKDECLRKTLEGLRNTVDFSRHDLGLSINGHTEETGKIINEYHDIIDLIVWNRENLGTAEAINQIWKDRKPGQHCIKMDDDILIHEAGWVDKLVEVVTLDPTIGQAGLKRKDCIETPWHPDEYYRSELKMLPHTPGHPWVIVEQASHVMGSCVLHSADLLKKVGYLCQPRQYGWDDVLMSARSIGAGFKNVFLPQINIDHIDHGQTPYQGWKERVAMQDLHNINTMIYEYKNGIRNVFYNPFEATVTT